MFFFLSFSLFFPYNFLGSLLGFHWNGKLLALAENLECHLHIQGCQFVTWTSKKLCIQNCWIRESRGTNIPQHFDECFNFIDEAKRMGVAVLVHCFVGRSKRRFLEPLIFPVWWASLESSMSMKHLINWYFPVDMAKISKLIHFLWTIIPAKTISITYSSIIYYYVFF